MVHSYYNIFLLFFTVFFTSRDGSQFWKKKISEKQDCHNSLNSQRNLIKISGIDLQSILVYF